MPHQSEHSSRRTVWKYELTWDDIQVLDLPYGSKILSVSVQNERDGNEVKQSIVLYVLVDKQWIDAQERVKHTIHVCGTGHPVVADWNARFLGTVRVGGDDRFAFHVFVDPPW